MEGKTQETAAAKAGMSVRSARNWQSGPLPSQAKPEHRWRTRPDPFDGVWEDEIEPLLRNDPTGKLKATTIIDWLGEQHPGRFSASQLRTLQRRLQDWRALHGPEREVYFPQVHPPGREAQFDFTHCGELKVTIAGQPYPHLLFQLILSHSGWRYAEVAAGETFRLQAADLGGVPEVVQYLGGHPRIAQGGRVLKTITPPCWTTGLRSHRHIPARAMKTCVSRATTLGRRRQALIPGEAAILTRRLRRLRQMVEDAPGIGKRQLEYVLQGAVEHHR